MDGHDDLFEVLSGEPDSTPVLVSPAEDVEELRLLRFDALEDIERILRQYRATPAIKPAIEMFQKHLILRRDSWFVEVGDKGLVYFTDVIPGFGAYVNAIFWDMKFNSPRRLSVLVAVRTAMERFELQRVTALCPSNSPSYKQRLEKMKFKLEGTLRKAAPGGEDMHIYGMLREEVPCHILPMTSLV